LTNRINITSSVIAESNNFNVNEAYRTSNSNSFNNNVEYDASSSSPKKYDDTAAVYLTTSMPPVETNFIESNSDYNFSNSNDTLAYEQTAHIETLPKRNSVKNIMNDDEYEPQSTYIVEQQPTGNLCW
jgi:hypothetical protein